MIYTFFRFNIYTLVDSLFFFYRIISPNLKSTVYCTGIAEGGEDEWNFTWEQYLSSDLASEKATILSALGCSKEVWILSR